MRLLRQYGIHGKMDRTLTQDPRVLSVPDLSRGPGRTSERVWFLWLVENPKWK